MSKHTDQTTVTRIPLTPEQQSRLQRLLANPAAVDALLTLWESVSAGRGAQVKQQDKSGFYYEVWRSKQDGKRVAVYLYHQTIQPARRARRGRRLRWRDLPLLNYDHLTKTRDWVEHNRREFTVEGPPASEEENNNGS